MRNLRQILSEIAEPKSPAEKNFKDKHVVDIQTTDDQETVVAATKKTKKDKSRVADYQDGADEMVYEAEKEEVKTDESAFIAKAAYAKKEGKKKFKLGDEEFPVTIKKSTVDKVTNERALTPDEEKEKEDIVMGMKKNKEDLKKRYGADWKSVMYATATKRAQESINEAVEISHDRYMRSHGKKASGRGLWMFSSKRSGDVDYTDSKQVYQPDNTLNKSFTDAAKDAAEWAKKNGHSVVYVMEAVETKKELKEQAMMVREYDYAQIVPLSGDYYIGIQYTEGEGPSVDLLKQMKKPSGKMDKAYKDMGLVSVGRNDTTADFKRKAEQMLKKMGLMEYYDMGMGSGMGMGMITQEPEDNDIVDDLEREVAEAKLRAASFKIDYVIDLIDSEDFELPMGVCGYIDTIKYEVDNLYRMIESMAPMDESTNLDEKMQEQAKKQLYYKTYSDAVKAAMDMAKKRGFEVDEDEYFRKVSAGPKKPSEGKTVSQSLQLMKDGKPLRKTLEFQIYNRGGSMPFELNHYIGESVVVEQDAEKFSMKKLKDMIKKIEKEEVETLDEISKKKALSYFNKANKEYAGMDKTLDGKTAQHIDRKAGNRRAGIKTAALKLTGGAGVNARKED
jgi:hypothetical protein